MLDIGELQITGGGGRHAVIHPEIPVVDNTVFQLGTASDPAQLVHPGDSLWVPPVPVGVLAIPAVAPWMQGSGTPFDYLRAVNPRTAIPIHFGIIEPAAYGIYFGRLRTEMAPAGTEFRVLKPRTRASSDSAVAGQEQRFGQCHVLDLPHPRSRSAHRIQALGLLHPDQHDLGLRVGVSEDVAQGDHPASVVTGRP